MKNLKKQLRAAIVQASPVLFDKKATIDKVVRQIMEAGQNGAELIVFPESLIPCYPYGLTFGFTVGSRNEDGRKDWKVYYDNAVVVPDDTISIAAAAKKAHAYVSIGVTERDPVNCSLYCSNLIFSPEGELVSLHRKIKPTGAERYIWADSHVPETYFPMVDTEWGRMGSLICWENYMPLARVALYEKGVALYLAPNTNDNPEWQDTIKHIAIEGHCYVFNVDQYFTKDMYPSTLLEQEEISRLNDETCTGGSCIIDPYGHYVTEPVWNKEAIIYADLDMDKVPMSRMEFDATGHYSRPDILEFYINDGDEEFE
ncbi:carbon-nitrogen hydrolase family protein [uncultured Megasphaera sp.]|jgi:nitrilase|uniref:carbon-nitrogen hydrolase family protein n=1 Tax=uncultured Megasphaera sp. TaxID=165188 RepID=UPI0025ED50C1|nr:carbon-nitrogen hydrolase family protein [uncultured Megasphaera sp.]